MTKSAPENVTVCPMELGHVDDVLAIERTFPAPWTREMFLQELRRQWEESEALVAIHGDRLVGYVLCWFVADEIHIVNLAVQSELRRRGIGRYLMQTICDLAERRNVTVATLEVRFHNEAAIALYESLGFRSVAIRKSYYADNGEDALVMLKEFGAHASSASREAPGRAGR